MSLSSGFLGYVSLSAMEMSALVITGGTTVCGMLGGPGLRAIFKRGMSYLNHSLGHDHQKDSKPIPQDKDKEGEQN